MKRVVADTNVLVSALQFGGKPKQLLDLAVDGQVDLAVSTEIVAETLRVLGQKFDRGSEWLTEADRQLRVIARIVAPAETIQAIEADPTDDRILECAVAAGAEVIVSGDAHLLPLAPFVAYGFNAWPNSCATFRNRAEAKEGIVQRSAVSHSPATPPRSLSSVMKRVPRGRRRPL